MVMSEIDIIEFFNKWAEVWDDDMVIDEDIIRIILDVANVSEGKKVLDVACGTGVLIPFYEDRNVESVTGIDISPRMIEIARSKFNINFICDNAVTYDYEDKYDSIVIYNAFPHFDDPDKTISHLSKYLNDKGTLTVAHSMSRDKINEHHDNVMNVSRLLPDLDEMNIIFSRYLEVTDMISNERMYLVSGTKHR